MTDRPSPFPFNDILALIDELPPMPSGNGCGGPATADVSLPVPGGTLAAHAAWLARWQDSATPRLRRPVVAVFAASHAEPAVSASGDSIARVEDFVAASQSREALVCRVCDRHGLGLRVFELAPEIPVADFASDAAMDEADCAATMAYGMEATAGGADLLVLRACAAGHEASVAAMAALLLGPAGRQRCGHEPCCARRSASPGAQVCPAGNLAPGGRARERCPCRCHPGGAAAASAGHSRWSGSSSCGSAAGHVAAGHGRPLPDCCQ
jgi:hypothetical protein